MNEVLRIRADRFAALGHEARLAVLRILLSAHPAGLVAGELQDELGLPASTLSHHLDALRRQGLVTQEREGRNLRYRAAVDTLRELLAFLHDACCSRSGESHDCGLLPEPQAARRRRVAAP